jgi:hypothetical protein
MWTKIIIGMFGTAVAVAIFLVYEQFHGLEDLYVALEVEAIIVIGILVFFLERIFSFSSRIKKIENQVDAELGACPGRIENLLDRKVVQKINAIPGELRRSFHDGIVRTPALFSGGYDDVIRSIFEIRDPNMRTAVIEFTSETLKSIKDTNGFPLSKQEFRAYQLRSVLFYKAIESSIHMTCTISPLEYFVSYANPGKWDPEHLILFNGMVAEVEKSKSTPIERVRVMCVADRLPGQIEQYPRLFAASYLWFLFLNVNFDQLLWSDQSPEDDIIIFDKKFMWKYATTAQVLYLKSVWNSSGSRLHEWEIWFEHSGKYQDFLQHFLVANGKEKIWNIFLDNFKLYLRDCSTAGNKKRAAEPAFDAFRRFSVSLSDLVEEMQGDYRLLIAVKKVYKGLSNQDKENLGLFFGDFKTKYFRQHVLERLGTEVECALNKVKVH